MEPKTDTQDHKMEKAPATKPEGKDEQEKASVKASHQVFDALKSDKKPTDPIQTKLETADHLPGENKDKIHEGADANSEREGASTKAVNQVFDALIQERKGTTSTNGASLERAGGAKPDDSLKNIPEKESSFFADAWDALFNWGDKKESTDSKQPPKDTGNDKSWFDFFFDDPFGQGKSDKHSSHHEHGGIFRSLGKDELEALLSEGTKPGSSAPETSPLSDSAFNQAKLSTHSGDFETLSDGTKIAKDRSWVELSETLAKTLKAASADEAVLHKFKDQSGREVQLEIKDGKVTHTSPEGVKTVIEAEKITIARNEGTTITRLKDGEVDANNEKKGLKFHQEANGDRVATTQDGRTIRYTKNEKGEDIVVITKKDGTQRKFEKDVFEERLKDRLIRINSRDHADSGRPRGPKSVFYDPSKGWEIHDKDDTIIRRHINGKISIQIKNGPEIRIDEHGNAQVKDGDGKFVPLTKKNLPAGCSLDKEGRIHLKSGLVIKDRHITAATGDEIDGKSGEVVVKEKGGCCRRMQAKANGEICVDDPNGEKTRIDTKTQKVVVTEPGGEVLTWDGNKGELKTDEITFKPGETILWDGTIVGINGEIQTPEGTEIDKDGDVHFADGTNCDSHGNVSCADGKQYHCSGGAGGPSSPESAAAYASGIAAAIVGKSTVTSSDIAALGAALSAVSGLLPILTEHGCITAYAHLKDAEGNLLVAMNHAQNVFQPGQNPKS